MKRIGKLKCLNSLSLKIMAMVFMLCDHLWATIIPGNSWLTNIGRLAFPIFAFQIAEGYYETGSFKRYLKRLFVFALISEIPFNLMYAGEIFFPFHQNVLFSFCLGLLLMRWIDSSREKGRLRFAAVLFAAAVVGFLAGSILMLDYYGFGILMLLLFFLCRNLRFGWVGELIGMLWINAGMMAGLTLNFCVFGMDLFIPQQAIAVLALIPIWLYNRQQGPHSRKIKLLCYSFYPVHMLVLALAARFL